MLFVRADDRPSESAFDAFFATALLVMRFEFDLAMGHPPSPPTLGIMDARHPAKVNVLCPLLRS